MGAWRHALSLDSASQLVLMGRGIGPGLRLRGGRVRGNAGSEASRLPWPGSTIAPCALTAAAHICLGPGLPTAGVRNAPASGLLCPKVLMLGEDGSQVQRTEPTTARLGFLCFLCNCGTIHIELTLLAVCRCPVQGHSAHSHNCAAAIAVHPHSCFIFPNHNSVPMKQDVASPLPSPWRPPFPFLSLRI